MKNRHIIIPIFIPQEGCPHKCVFCNQETISGETRSITGLDVKNTIEEYLETIDRENTLLEVSFFGGTFTGIDINKQRELLGVAKEYKDQGKIDKIRMSTRPDYIDEEIIEHLKAYTVDIVELGVQSIDEEVLLKSGRGHTRQDVYQASRLIREAGITLGHQIMLGLPGDTKEKDIYTTEESIKMGAEICRIYPTLVIKNTPMEVMQKKGIYKPYTLDEAIDICKVIYLKLIKAGINVIRVGLQTTDEINEGGEVLSGPFHPAFRELVEGSIIADAIYEIAKVMGPTVTLRVNDKDLSRIYCDKKKYFKGLLEKLGKTINVVTDETIERLEIRVVDDNSSTEYTIKNFEIVKNK